jgi:hypothetical protein
VVLIQFVEEKASVADDVEQFIGAKTMLDPPGKRFNLLLGGRVARCVFKLRIATSPKW